LLCLPAPDTTVVHLGQTAERNREMFP